MVFYRAESKLFFLSKIFVQKLAVSPNFLISKLVFEQVFCAFLGCVCDLTVWKAVRSRYSVSKTLTRPLRWLTLRLIVLTVWWRSDNLRGFHFSMNVNLEKTLKNVTFSSTFCRHLCWTCREHASWPSGVPACSQPSLPRGSATQSLWLRLVECNFRHLTQHKLCEEAQRVVRREKRECGKSFLLRVWITGYPTKNCRQNR